MRAVGLDTLISELGDLWLEARCVCGCLTQFPRRYLESEGLGHVRIGDWADRLACVHCGGAELEIGTWNGVLDLGYGSQKPERTVLLLAGEVRSLAQDDAGEHTPNSTPPAAGTALANHSSNGSIR